MLDEFSELLDSDNESNIKAEPVKVKIIEQEHAPLLQSRTMSGLKAQGEVWRGKQENPRQRMVLELAAKGKTNKEIAELTGYHPVSVSAILRQPHTQQVLVDEIRKNVDNIDAEVVEIIKEGCLESAKRLLKIVKDDKAKGSDHVAAANQFFERRYGKANQPINRGTDVDLNNLSDADLAKMITTDGTGNTKTQ